MALVLMLMTKRVLMHMMLILMLLILRPMLLLQHTNVGDNIEILAGFIRDDALNAATGDDLAAAISIQILLRRLLLGFIRLLMTLMATVQMQPMHWVTRLMLQLRY